MPKKIPVRDPVFIPKGWWVLLRPSAVGWLLTYPKPVSDIVPTIYYAESRMPFGLNPQSADFIGLTAHFCDLQPSYMRREAQFTPRVWWVFLPSFVS